VIRPPLIDAATEVQTVLLSHNLRCCVIGGLAVNRWGEPRVTQDVDFSVLAPPGGEQRALDVVLGLVLYKLVAARPGDIADIEGIVRRQGRNLDGDRIRRYGTLFAELKEDPDLLRPFEAAMRRAAE
jgi:hypothetical protein